MEVKDRVLALLPQIDGAAIFEKVIRPPDQDIVIIEIRKNNRVLETRPITGTEWMKSPLSTEKDELVRERLLSALQ